MAPTSPPVRYALRRAARVVSPLVPGMQDNAAQATSHNDPSPFMYFMIASANSTNAAANTTHANGPPMISATIPSTATTTFAMVTITSHASPAQSLNFSHRDRSGIPASDASWILPAVDRPSASRNDLASNANARAWSNRACAAATAASAESLADRAEDNRARASRTCSGVGSKPGFVNT